MKPVPGKFFSEIDAELDLASDSATILSSRTFGTALTPPQHRPPQVLLSASLDLRRRRRGARGIQGAADSLGGLLRAAQESGIASSRCNGFVKVNWCHGATEVDALSLTDPVTTPGLLNAAVLSGAWHVVSPGQTVGMLGSQLTRSWLDWRPEVDHSIAGGGVSDPAAKRRYDVRPPLVATRPQSTPRRCAHPVLLA